MTRGIADAGVTPTAAIGWAELKRPPRRGERPGGMAPTYVEVST